MKNLTYIIIISFFGFMITACGNEENEAVPSYLDGTQYGVLLHVEVTSSNTIAIADVGTATVDFMVSFEGDKRPVASVRATKTFVPAGGTASATLDQMTITSLPSTVSLTINDLVNGIAGLTSSADLQVDDAFQLEFIITYEDGGVVTRFGTLNDPSFSVNFN